MVMTSVVRDVITQQFTLQQDVITQQTSLLNTLLAAGRPNIFVRIGVWDGSFARHASFIIRGHNDPLF